MTQNLVRLAPILKVRSFAAAEAFYTLQLGFTKDWAYHAFPDDGVDPGYGGFSREGLELHVTSFGGDGRIGHAVLLYVRDVDALHAEFAQKDVIIDLPPTDQPWGTRDMYVLDPDGNCLRFCQSDSVAGARQD